MNRRADVGSFVGAHAKPHHREAGAAHDEQTKCSTANTEPTTTVRTAHTLIRPPQHDTWPGKPSAVLVCCSCQYTDRNIIHRVSYVIERHQRQMPIPHGSSSWEVRPMTENTWPSHGGNVCSSGGSNVVNGRGTPTVPSVIVVHRKRAANAPKSPLPEGRP